MKGSTFALIGIVFTVICLNVVFLGPVLVINSQNSWVDLENGRSHQFISSVGSDNQTVWFCCVTDHGHWLRGNYTLAKGVAFPVSPHWDNRTDAIVDVYWDGTYYYDNETGSGPWKTLIPVYGNASDWVFDAWVYVTLKNGVVVKLEVG
jgi:hypothetical protein